MLDHRQKVALTFFASASRKVMKHFTGRYILFRHSPILGVILWVGNILVALNRVAFFLATASGDDTSERPWGVL